MYLPNGPHSPRKYALLAFAFACIAAWTIVDSLRTGQIQTGRGLWHRNVDRDDDPVNFWFAIVGNCVVFVGAITGGIVLLFQ